MAEQLDIPLVECQCYVIEFCVQLGKHGSVTLQFIHQAYGDDTMRQAVVFKWWKQFRDGETNVKDEPSVGKVMLILFFNAKRLILQHWVPQGQTFSGQYYCHCP
jgi:hypothetical protein